ncbi:class GN sortase [Hellea balneolensis]|uniref:class GN sortase n=1 Tax=Hellea balneolensis TaxID=287478 RepID=UPI00041A57B6|nr:class GN sortase [Hellea balneolensis]
MYKLGVISALIGAALFGNGIYIGGKALLAQHLLERSWTKTISSGEVHLPWDWMDAYPVARIKFEGQANSHIVLNTDSGQALAFGPAVISGTENTNMLAIAAHKNTQFQNLKELKSGEVITLEPAKGDKIIFRVTHSEILDSREQELPIGDASETPSNLALVTCYPFDAISFNGPLRYVVYAERMNLRKTT